MNKNALTKKSTYKVGKTDTAKLPNSVGFPGNMQGVTRKLSNDESERQRALQLTNTRF